MTAPTPWYSTRRGRAIVGLYTVSTVIGLVVSTGGILDGVVFPETDGPAAAIPVHIYLYAFLGGMTYAFTSLVAKFERGVDGVVRVGLRALAALPLAAGVHLLAGPLGISTGDGGMVAGVAFLVGLYVNLTLKTLGGLADRLYGRPAGGREDQ